MASLFILFLSIILFGGGNVYGQNLALEKELNIFSTRALPSLEKLFSDFTEETNIRINKFEINEGELKARILEGNVFGEIDLYLTSGVLNILEAEKLQLFEEFYSPLLEETIPQNLMSPAGNWSGISYWPRVIIYNKALIDPVDVLNYEDLSKANFKNLVCLPPSSHHSNISLLSSLIENLGIEKALAWARALKSNLARDPQGGEIDQIISVNVGECGLALVDYSYYLKVLSKENITIEGVEVNIGVIFPNQGNRGSFVNISVAGLIKQAPKRENAIRFLLYLSTLNTQNFYAKATYEYPVNNFVLNSQNFFKFKMDDINISDLEKNVELAKEILNEVGWN